MASPAYEFPVPSSFASWFPNGEKAISPVTPLESSTGPITYYMARMVELQGGTYEVTFLGKTAATLWVGPDSKSTRMLLSARLTDGVLQTSIYLPAGTHRMDVLLQDLTAPADSSYFVMTLRRNGAVVYASDADGWVWSPSPIADDDVMTPVDERWDLPVFSVLPNWKNGILERLSWLTDIMVSESGNEQRRGLRIFPRRSFEANFMRVEHQRARLDTFFVAVGKKPFLLPLWHEQYKTPGINAGDTYLQFPAETLALREFRAGDLVFINNGNPDDFAVLEIANINTSNDRVTWATPPTRSWPAGTRAFPLRVVRLLDNPQLASLSDRVAETAARFELVANDDDFNPSWNYCAPLFRFKPHRTAGITTSYDRLEYILDNQVASPAVVDTGERALVGQEVTLRLFGREQMVKLRSLLSITLGRAVRFYMPTFTHDIQPVADMDGMYFDAKPTGFAQLMDKPQWARRIVSVVFKDGRPTIYRQIDAVEPIGIVTPGDQPVAERFHLQQYMPPVRLSEIERMSFVVPSRFDQDSFEIKHHTDGGKVITTQLVTRSIDGDGMEPIECFVTSRPYPLLTTEAMDTTVTISGGRLLGNIYPDEAMNMAMTLEGGDLRTPLITYVMSDEAMNLAMTLDGGDLRAVLRDYTMLDEAVDTTVSIAGGVLDQSLISYEMLDEAMDTTITISGGVLA